eukprot:scaffold327565_cov139-Tisochrysis_lutea.AAC.1
MTPVETRDRDAGRRSRCADDRKRPVRLAVLQTQRPHPIVHFGRAIGVRAHRGYRCESHCSARRRSRARRPGAVHRARLITASTRHLEASGPAVDAALDQHVLASERKRLQEKDALQKRARHPPNLA